MPSLFHHLKTPVAFGDDWVRRGSIKPLVAAIAGTSLGVARHDAARVDDTVFFKPDAPETTPIYPFEIEEVTFGFAFAVGRVIGYTVGGTGSTIITPVIGGVAINHASRPFIDKRSNGVIAVELNLRLNRGVSPGIPYSISAQHVTTPEVKWLTSITESLGIIDGTAYSYCVAAVPLFKVENDKITRLRWSNITPRSYITGVIA